MTSASPVLGSNQASFQVPNPPFKKLPTLPDGNCLIHAIFGLLYEGGVYCEEAPSQRIQIAQKFRQHSKKHPCEVLRSFVLRSKVTQENIDLEWLTRSMERDKEFLGLEHAELIAKTYRLNIRVYHEETYEKVDLFYNNNQAPSPDGIISFDGVGHWSQCVCPKPFANTFSGGLRFSYSTLQKRFEKNQGSVQAQERENKREVSTSSFFKDGYQESDEPFQSFLQNSWVQIGRGAVVDAAAEVIIRSLSEPEETHPDITQYFDRTDLDDKTTRYRSPNYALAGELQVLIQKHALLHYQLLQLLRINNRKLMDKLKPDTREWDAYTQRGDYGNSFWDIPHCILTWGTMGGAAAFSQTAVDKFRSLLARELVIIYLKEDNARIHYFQGREISPVTIHVPSLAAYEEYKKVILNASKAEAFYGWTVRRREKAWEIFKHTVKNELSHVTISGGVSLIMANPVPVVSQGVSSGISAFKAFVDPYDDQTRLHEVMPYVSPTMSLIQGDVSGAVIGVSCDIYLREQLKDHPSTELGKNFFVSSCKGVLTGSVEGYANSMVSFALTEAGQRVAPEDHFDNSIPTRLFRAALTSKDATGLVASQLTRAVDRRFNPIYFDRSHLATQAPEVVDIVYQVDESRGDYYIKLMQNGEFQKKVGTAPSKEKAQDICNQLNYVIQQVNTLNSCAFGLQEAYEKAGIPLNEIPGKLTFAIPYFEMTGDGTKTKVYLNGEKTFTGTGFKASMDALKTQVNTRIQEYEATLKQNFPEFQGTQIPIPKPTKVSKEHGFWYNFWRHPLETLDDYGIGVNVNVNVEVPLYAEPKKPTYTSPPATVDPETIEVGRKEPSVRAPSVPTEPSNAPQYGTWQDVQSLQSYNTMEALMRGDYRRPIEASPSAPFISQLGDQDLIRSWGQGVIEAGIHLPQDIAYKVHNWFSNFIEQWKTDPIQARNEMDLCLVVGAKNVCVAVLKIFSHPTLEELRGLKVESGLDQCSDKFDKWYAETFALDLTSPSAQLGTFIGEVVMPIPLVGKIQPGVKMGKEAVEIVKHSNEIKTLLKINNPVYHSGIGNPFKEMLSAQPKSLVRRNVTRVRTDWVFPKKGGATINGRWYTEHALERMAPRTPEVMAELEARTLDRAAKKGLLTQTEKFGKWMEKNAPDPRGIPPSVIEAEIAKPGSTNIRVELNKKGDVITVIPRGQK